MVGYFVLRVHLLFTRSYYTIFTPVPFDVRE